MNAIQHDKTKSLLRRISRFILITLAAVWIFIEEWIWDSILAVMEYIVRLKPVRAFETFLRRQNQYLLLFLFVFPFLIMVPAKLFGLYLIANGKIVRGVVVFVIAKVTITALVTRLFVVSREKLLLIKSFAAFYYWFKDKKEWLYSEVRKLPAWQKAREFMHKLRNSLKSSALS